MSFGPNYADMHRRAAYVVDRILKGTPPASLPVAPPPTFELIINQKTARALDIVLSPSLLLRADQGIEKRCAFPAGELSGGTGSGTLVLEAGHGS